MLGLRLTQEGVSLQSFQARFGQSLMDVFGKEVDELVHLGLLEKVPTSEVFAKYPLGAKTLEVLRLTPRGRLLGNQVFLRFVD